MKTFIATYGIYTRNAYIMGEEDYEFEAETLADAQEEAKAHENELENYYPCAMLNELVEIEEETK